MMPPSESAALRHLMESALVTPATRAALEKRLDAAQQPTAPRFFDADLLALLNAVCARLLPQPERAAPIPLASEIDARLAENEGDGWRYADMPPDRDAYQLGLRGIDEMARTLFAQSFTALEAAHQDEILRAVQRGDVRGESWARLSPIHFFQELLAECAEIYYSHPLAQMEIGYIGFADAHGWQALGLNERDWMEQAGTQGVTTMARNESNASVGKKNKGASQDTPKKARKGSGPGTTKGTRKRTEIGLSKGLNKGGAQGVAHSGEPKPRTK